MGRIFLFWVIILIVLIAGIGAIIYGKILLKTEEKKAKEIIMELSTTEIPKVDIIPPPLSGVETEEIPDEIKPAEPMTLPEEQQSLPSVSQ
jgi:hypothetical protein